jgi:hypothetical protein
MLLNPAARKRLLTQIITATPHETPGESSTMPLDRNCGYVYSRAQGISQDLGTDFVRISKEIDRSGVGSSL